MKLHRFDGQFAMPHTHDHAIFGFRGDLQTRRKRLPARKQRVIAAHLKLRGQPVEHADPAILYGGWLAVHRVIEHTKGAPEGLHDALQTQAYAEHRSEERRVGKECRSRWSP